MGYTHGEYKYVSKLCEERKHPKKGCVCVGGELIRMKMLSVYWWAHWNKLPRDTRKILLVTEKTLHICIFQPADFDAAMLIVSGGLIFFYYSI